MSKFEQYLEILQEAKFKNGDKVYLKKEYEDEPGERFTVSQCDDERGRCWLSDKDGRGWYVYFDQIQKKKP